MELNRHKIINDFIKLIIFMSVLFIPFSLSGREKSLSDIQFNNQKKLFTCIYNHIQREYTLYIPSENCHNMPLLFMLHGYGDRVEQFISSTKMNDTAKKYNIAVVYPQGIRNPYDKMSAACWNSGLNNKGNDDTGFLCALAKYLQDEYGFDKSRTFATGFSNGGFMMYRLAVEAEGTFSGVASVAGFMTQNMWKKKHKHSSINILQINGTLDDVVPMLREDGSITNSGAPLINDVINYWKTACGAEHKETFNISNNSLCCLYKNLYNNTKVCQIIINGGRHSWPETKYSGFDVNSFIIEYFLL